MFGIIPEFWSILLDAGRFLPEFEFEIKNAGR